MAVLVLSFNTWQRGEKCINVGQRGGGVALREATEEDGGRGGGKHRFALLWGELPPLPHCCTNQAPSHRCFTPSLRASVTDLQRKQSIPRAADNDSLRHTVQTTRQKRPKC